MTQGGALCTAHHSWQQLNFSSWQMLTRCAKKVIFDQELMVDDKKEQKLAQNCRTRDNFVRDWLHQLLYWVLSLLLVGSRAKFLPIEARRFSLLDTTLHYISFLSCNHQNVNKAKKCSMVQSGLPDSLSSTHLFIYSSCLAIIDHKNATKNAAGHNRDPQIFSPWHNTTYIYSCLSCNHQNATKCTRAHFLPIEAHKFSNLSTTPFSCNLHFSIVDESSECTAS